MGASEAFILSHKMANAVTIRIYRIETFYQGQPHSINGRRVKLKGANFVKNFVELNSSINRSDDLERTWFLEEKESDGLGSSCGLIHYGSFGFTSTIIDSETRDEKFHRAVDDIEQIPLFYELLIPKTEGAGFFVFQSFGGKSCISLIMAKFKRDFEEENEGFAIFYKKVMPTDGETNPFANLPVTKMTFVTKGVSGDIIEEYTGVSPESVNVEINISSKRRQILGRLKDIMGASTKKEGALVFKDIEFSKLYAEVKYKNRKRRVGVIGSDEEVGFIDITDEVTRGPDGHPEFSSIREESRDLLSGIMQTLRGLND
ncbi:hypothetical protein [Niveispirillum sp. KHB5.9]|uniref:hypothetical protein n=1 Tax=Niveispirillum sp. KHB5.9 TaxID=3400269 RepID=UPI003A884153